MDKYLSICFLHRERLQPEPAAAGVNACPDIEFKTMPWANDVAIDGVEPEARRCLRFIQMFHNPRQDPSLANRPTLMRTPVAVGVILPLVADHADLDRARRHHYHTAVGEIAFSANQYFSHRVALSLN